MAGAFIAAIVLTRVNRSATSSANVNLSDSTVQGKAERLAGPPEKSKAADLNRISLQPNPAAQKAGSPNPAMRSTAEAAAENAAKAAADLAGK
jgi:hypothetical protein